MIAFSLSVVSFSCMLFFRFSQVFPRYSVVHQLAVILKEVVGGFFLLLVGDFNIGIHEGFLLECYSPMKLGDLYPELF